MIAIGCKIDETRTDGDVQALIRDLRTFEALGAEAVEIPPHGLDLIMNGRLRDSLAKEIRTILMDFPFRYSVHAPNPINLMDQNAPSLHVSALKSTLDFASMIGAKVVVYHGGRFVPEERFPVLHQEPELRWDQRRRMWEQEVEELSRLADGYPNLVIAIENARPYMGYSPYSYAERADFLTNMISSVARPNVGATLDVGHMWMASKFYRFDFLTAIHQMSPWIMHVHMHDNFGTASYPHEKQQTHQIPLGKGDSHMPIGWGEIPLREVLDKIIPPFNGTIIVELRSRYFRFTGDCLRSLREILEARLNLGREEGRRWKFGVHGRVNQEISQEARSIS